MEQSKYESAIEVIGQAMFDYFPDRGKGGRPLIKEDQEAEDNVSSLLSCVENGYCLVQWPESQEYMEEEWFEEEAILAMGSDEQLERFGGSAYFIPIKYVV